ncbi:single-stranded DNA-binding protein [Desulfovibrio sulfodismutans]|uniref:Single-stranded DNA-binding protein n=1 Tax=Desulfolutivibrio sulfodismutans TaxID=63561 RepID=A0A7K3NQA2_9BACT|nr:single-stranded DNA-binding protein [Desulfolutivibrio sulfodismutans]NDY57389.1 single-stranded DNA-binding protein [Desulfolutivibrio sulfodismutans]QLA12912.1 single-stranded DNA-binding protein [Desulfolutivibrio sulfodismutans DSM 3696]
MNKVTLIGRLGVQPRGGSINGTTFSNFSIATHEHYKDVFGNRVERTTWHRIVVFGRAAQFANDYLDKGRNVLVEGRMNYRQYQDRDGVERVVAEVVARQVQALDAKGKSGGDDEHGTAPAGHLLH